MATNDMMFAPKETYKDNVTNINVAVKAIESILVDAIAAKNTISKNALMNVCMNQCTIILDSLNALRKVDQYLVAHPHATAAEVRAILKEVGLQDMDDPNYGSNYMFPCNVFKEDALNAPKSSKNEVNLLVDVKKIDEVKEAAADESNKSEKKPRKSRKSKKTDEAKTEA